MSYCVVQPFDHQLGAVAREAATRPAPKFLVLDRSGGWRESPALGRQCMTIEEATVALFCAKSDLMDGDRTPQLEVRIFEHRVGGWWIGPRIWPDPEPIELIGSLA